MTNKFHSGDPWHLIAVFGIAWPRSFSFNSSRGYRKKLEKTRHFKKEEKNALNNLAQFTANLVILDPSGSTFTCLSRFSSFSPPKRRTHISGPQIFGWRRFPPISRRYVQRRYVIELVHRRRRRERATTRQEQRLARKSLAQSRRRPEVTRRTCPRRGSLWRSRSAASLLQQVRIFFRSTD